VIVPANTLCHLLERPDLEACLRSVRRHLSRGGKFVVDVFNPRLDILLRDPGKRYPHSEYEDPDGSGLVRVSETNRYDATSQINTVTLFYSLPNCTEEHIETMAMRIYYPQELDELLNYNGFRIEAKYGDYNRSPFRSSSQRQLVVSHVSAQARSIDKTQMG
jgi:hypothetical protein